jgi:hypothetical protein
MELIVIINAIANLILTVSVAAFMTFLFGRCGMIYRISKIEQWTVKIGLAGMAAGSLFNFFKMEKPSGSEALLHCGLAVIFVWAAIFHYNHFVKKLHKKSKFKTTRNNG